MAAKLRVCSNNHNWLLDWWNLWIREIDMSYIGGIISSHTIMKQPVTSFLFRNNKMIMTRWSHAMPLKRITHWKLYTDTNSEGFNFANYYQFGKLNFDSFLGGHMDISIKSPYKINRYRLKWLSHMNLAGNAVWHTLLCHIAQKWIKHWQQQKLNLADGGHLKFWLRLVKIKKWCQKCTFHATFSKKSGITRVSLSIYF